MILWIARSGVLSAVAADNALCPDQSLEHFANVLKILSLLADQAAFIGSRPDTEEGHIGSPMAKGP